MTLEILCATMHQKDFSKIEEMNIHCDVLFANQANENRADEIKFGSHTARMITTTTTGVGKNRNIALKNAQGSILLFADDDIVYSPDMTEAVLKAFDELSDADVIVFGSKSMKHGEIYETKLPKTERLSFFNSMKYGTYAIAVKKESILKNEIRFTELFGGGCIYSHGEDSDFLLQCYKKRLNIYSYNYILGVTSKDVSTCFTGYTEKYYFDKGALAKHSFSFSAPLYIIYIVLRTRKRCEISTSKAIKATFAGYFKFKKLISYDEWKRKQK